MKIPLNNRLWPEAGVLIKVKLHHKPCHRKVRKTVSGNVNKMFFKKTNNSIVQNHLSKLVKMIQKSIKKTLKHFKLF